MNWDTKDQPLPGMEPIMVVWRGEQWEDLYMNQEPPC